MLYVDFTAGNKDYKLRINTRNTVVLEKQLGCNPLAIFGDGDRLPTVTEMVNILYASLQQLNHGISLNDAYDIFTLGWRMATPLLTLSPLSLIFTVCLD